MINKRTQIALNNNLIVRLEEIGFAEKIKTRPKIIKFLINQYEDVRK